MTVGIAYLDPDAKRIVSKYSIILLLIGMSTFFSNIFQHYIYGLVGERATNNLREALFSGMALTKLQVAFYKEYIVVVYSVTEILLNKCSCSSE